MKKVTTLLILATLLFAACVNHIDEEEEEISKASPVKLLVETRAEGTAPLTYPITVYAFDAQGNCAASQTITSTGETLALNLVPGDYHITALAGTDGYTLPSPMQRTSLITMTGNTPATSALMSGNADVTVTDAAVSANIRLSYRVSRLALTLTEIPTEVTAVQVRFSPQYTGYSMQGSFSNAISVSELPNVSSIWRGTCVMGVSNRTATTATLLLMSVEEWEGLAPAAATSTANSYSLASLPGAWRLPTEAEVTTLRNARKALGTTGTFDALLTGAGGDATGASANYLCTASDGSYLKYTLGGTTAPVALGTTASFRLRAVRSVPVAITNQLNRQMSRR